jgi:hypothetical protein
LVETYNNQIANNPKAELIHVSRDSDEDSAEEWAAKEKFPWPTVLPDDGKKSGLMDYAGTAVPRYVLLDPDGKVLAESLSAALRVIEEKSKD